MIRTLSARKECDQKTNMTKTEPHRESEFDLIIRAGRVVDPSGGFDRTGAVAIRDDRIVEVGAAIVGSAKESYEFSDAVLLPGLVDLHAHPDNSGSVFGVEPDEHFLKRGTTTVMSQGDCGADNCAKYVEQTIESSATQVRLAINISRIGETTPAASCANLDDVDVGACVSAVERFPDKIWGIAVNVSKNTCEQTDPREVLRRGLLAATESNRPILYGMRPPQEWPFEEQMKLLRPGDVVTYCFRREPHCIVENARVHPAIREARKLGILFDVGHGMGSFDFIVAEAAIADGFPPDTISTDLHSHHQGQKPVHDLPLTMSKLRAAGMSEAEVFAAVTCRSAKILGLNDEIGTLSAGSCADLTVLRWNPDFQTLVDVNQNVRRGGSWKPLLTVRGGIVA